MCSLDAFPLPPPRGHRTVCEQDGRLVSIPPHSPSDVHGLSTKLLMYPRVSVNRSQLQPPASKDDLKSAFLAGRDTAHWNRVVSTWTEDGIICALGELSSGSGWLTCVAKVTMSIVRWTRILQGSMYPHWMLSCDEVVEKFSSAGDWCDGLIRCFAWHPHTTRFAIGLCDDTVKVYGSNARVVPVLKHRGQRKIADLAFRFFSGSTLAVACQAGVVVWNVDPLSVVTRPSSSCVQLLARKGHSPVTSVRWSPCGRLLASASPHDTSVIVWDVATEKCAPLKRVAGGGVSLLRWSIDGRRLFAATPGKVFRVWETVTWTCNWWSTGSGRCVAACWSPDGSVLLAAVEHEPFVYSVSFAEPMDGGSDLVGGSKNAVPVINVSAVVVNAESEQLSIGGPVQSMVWDSSGQRLAVSFKSKENRQEFVAVFRTRMQPVLDINPCGLIRGPSGDIVQCMDYHDGFDGGALLTVCWSSGDVSHIPFAFPSCETNVFNVSSSSYGRAASTPIGNFYSFTSPGKSSP